MAQAKQQKKKYSFMWKALTIAILLLIFYTVYHVAFGLSDTVPTTPAGIVEQRNSVILEGVIFREEELVSSDNKGDLRPYFSNGELVTTDEKVATIYSQVGNHETNQKISELEEKLDIMRRSNVKGLVSIVDIEQINSDIERLYTNLMLARSSGDNLKAKEIEKEYLICLNILKIYEGKVKNYNSEIKAIQEELDVLYNSFKGEKEDIFAENGGYIYYNCDGYEQALTQSVLENITIDGFADILAAVKKNPVTDSAYVCKFVHNNEWKIATLCDNEIVDQLKLNCEYSATIFDVRERSIKLKLEKIGESNGSQTLLTFSCDTMPVGFDYTRYQSIKLDISSIEGYRVPVEALQTVIDKETQEKIHGVYILNASVVYFRRVDIIGVGNGYYIVEKFDKSKENYHEYLNLNDLIILEPEGMYNGKTLKR